MLRHGLRFALGTFLAVSFCGIVIARAPQGLDPATIAKPPVDSWPTYHGDYSGRRYSTLKQITTGNVKGLALAWVYRLNTQRAAAIVGGEGSDAAPPAAPPVVKSTPLMING